MTHNEALMGKQVCGCAGRFAGRRVTKYKPPRIAKSPGRFGRSDAGGYLSILRSKVSTPIVASGDGKHGLEFHFVIDFKGDGLRGVAAAFAMTILKFVPVGTGTACAIGGFGFHDGVG